MSTKTPSERAAESANFMDRFEETAFKWGGLVMIFLAVAFAMGIAIDNGLFTPPLRVAAGISVGAALVGLGLFIYGGRPIFGQSLQGAGLAVVFLSVFAGHQTFAVISWEGAMAATVIVTGLSFWLAARRGDSALAAIGLLGGVAAPFVLLLGDGGVGGSSSGDAYVIYATTLLLAAVAVYYFNGWGSLLVTAGGLSLATFGAIVMQLERGSASSLLAQTGITVIALALWLVPVGRIVVGRPTVVSRHSVDQAWAKFFQGTELTTVVWAPVAAVAASVSIWSLAPTQAGLVSLAAAISVAAIGLTVRRDQPVLGLSHFIATSTLLALASALILEGPGLQLAFAGQAFAYLSVGRRAGAPVLGFAGAVLALPVMSWMLFDLAVAFDMGSRVDPAQLVAHATIVAFLGAGACLETHGGTRNAVGGVAHVLLALWLAEAFLGIANGQALTTASWIMLAAVAAYFGLRLESKVAVQAAVTTVLVAVAKLLTVDIIEINAVGRTISFFVAGIVLVGFGYNYPAMRTVIRGDGEPTVSL